MALIIFPEYGGTVSDKATVCFHCGYLLHSGATRKSLTLALITKLNIFAPRAGCLLLLRAHPLWLSLRNLSKLLPGR